MNAVTFLAADRDVIEDIRIERLKGLYQQGSGCLTIHIEVTPNADHLVSAYSQIDAFYCGLDIWEYGRGNRIRMQKRFGFFGRADSASEQSLRDERRQVEARERSGDVYGMRVKPASHLGKYHVSSDRCQVCRIIPCMVDIDYSGTPLAKKLGIKSPVKLLMVNAPQEYKSWLGDLPDGVALITKTNKEVEAAHVFTTESAFLDATLSKLQQFSI